ncbi:MAG TPA: hypothetical protein VN704_09355 [Verrucomicrobiae bacterium]|nr:hypothetical protein [Verrucomicrobiae bacterium]
MSVGVTCRVIPPWQSGFFTGAFAKASTTSIIACFNGAWPCIESIST